MMEIHQAQTTQANLNSQFNQQISQTLQNIQKRKMDFIQSDVYKFYKQKNLKSPLKVEKNSNFKYYKKYGNNKKLKNVKSDDDINKFELISQDKYDRRLVKDASDYTKNVNQYSISFNKLPLAPKIVSRKSQMYNSVIINSRSKSQDQDECRTLKSILKNGSKGSGKQKNNMNWNEKLVKFDVENNDTFYYTSSNAKKDRKNIFKMNSLQTDKN